MERYTQIAKSEVTKDGSAENQPVNALQSEGWQKDDGCREQMKKMQSHLSTDKNANLPKVEIDYDKSSHQKNSKSNID